MKMYPRLGRLNLALALITGLAAPAFADTVSRSA